MIPLSQIAAVARAESEPVFVDLLRKAASDMAFEHYMVGVVVARLGDTPLRHIATNFPQPQRQYVEERFRDSAAVRGTGTPGTSSTPENVRVQVWGPENAQNTKTELYEHSTVFGVANGLFVSMDERVGVKSMFAVARETPYKTASSHTDAIDAIRVLASCSHFAITNVVVPALIREAGAGLTVRERECMEWTASGKTANEISKILNVREATVHFHIGNVVTKFGVANKTQAAARAMAMGLIF